MNGRRRFLAGLIATGIAPKVGWASVGAPKYLAAAQLTSGAYRLCGLSAAGVIVFETPLPARGHAAAAHPHKAEAVAFARRPGNFAVVLDCKSGRVQAELTAPQGRHFYGHGVFTPDGDLLFTSENDYDAGLGVIGVWNAKTYTRIAEFSSGGVGPHDIALLPDGETLVIANGGIETHPDAGRTKLNIPTMRPNLSYMSLTGAALETVELAQELHKNSIRHLSVAQDGRVAFAMQWQGELPSNVPLLGLHDQGHAPKLLKAPDNLQRGMNGYAGSVAFSTSGAEVAFTSPRGNATHVFDAQGQFIRALPMTDVCGLAAQGDSFLQTSGQGAIRVGQADVANYPDRKWDNHLIPIKDS